MKDINNVTIKKGQFIKRIGFVQYADGKRKKVSKNTWLVSKVEDGKVYYENKFFDFKGQEVAEEVELRLPKDEGGYIVVGDIESGLEAKFEAPRGIVEAPVGQNYRVHVANEDKKWEVGDIVRIHGKVSSEMIERGDLELVPDSVPHKHILVVVDPIKLNFKLNNG